MTEQVYFITHVKDGFIYFLSDMDYAEKKITWDINKPYFFTDSDDCQTVFHTITLLLPEFEFRICNSYSDLVDFLNWNYEEGKKHGRKHRCSSRLS